MKKTLLIALLMIPFLGISQTSKPIDGFLGIKFGTGKADVIAALKAKGGNLVRDNVSDGSLMFKNVSLGNRHAQQLVVKLVDDKVYNAALVFQADNEPESLEYYNALVKDVSGVYGVGTPVNNFKSPFAYGDGNEVTAISGGFGRMSTTWTNGKNKVMVIMYGLRDIVFIQLSYVDGELTDLADAKTKAKDKSDF